MKLRSISIRWKLFFFLAFFLSVILVLLWLMEVVYLDKLFSNERIRQSRELSEKIEKNFGGYFRTGDFKAKAFRDGINRLAIQWDACIAIIDRNGTVRFTSEDILGNCIVHHYSSGLQFYRLFESTASSGGMYEEFNDTKWFDERVQNDSMLSCRMIKGDYEYFDLIVNTNILPLSSTSDALRKVLYSVSIAMLAVALVLAVFISRDISSPISKMNISAKKLATGNYMVKFSGGGYREITELAETLNFAASELSKVDRLKSELIANISHDLRTPLTMITGYAEMIRDLPGESSTENIQVIIDEAMRLNSLVNDLLDLSKLQAGAAKLQLTTFSLNDLAKEIIGRFNAVSEKNGSAISLISEDRDIMAIADRGKLSQVIYNLLTNAINYTGEDKKIEFAIIPMEGGKTRIEIRDNGPGVPEELKPYIWERYYRANDNHIRAEIGNGLGLSIVKTILELHEAKFGVETPEKGGSVFWFEL